MVRKTENMIIKIYRQWNYDKAFMNEMFMVQDLLGALTCMQRTDATVVAILNNEGTQEEKEENLKYVVSLFEDKEDVAILTWSYVSTKEFRPSEYYDPGADDEPTEYEKATKKPIPYDEVIERESKLLESVGFIDFNKFVQYEHSKAYLYGNKLGNEVLKYTKVK